MVKEIDVTKYMNEEKEDVSKVFDLSNSKELEELIDEVETQSIYFKPEVDITYKVNLTSTMVQKVDKVFEKDGKKEEIVKYAIGIKATDKKGTEFVGIWEVGKSILQTILKDFDVNTTFKITKTGTGLSTKYSVIKDF